MERENSQTFMAMKKSYLQKLMSKHYIRLMLISQ